MPKNISGTDPTHSDGVFGQILVNTFAVQLNASSTGFSVYNSVSTSPLFKIDGSGVSPSATFYCDLNVIGNASFTSVSNIAVTSSMMSLATGNTAADLVDIGFYGLYYSSSNKYRGLVRSTGLGRWVLFKDITTVPSTTVTLSGSWRDTLEVQDLYFNGDGSTLSALQASVAGLPSELNNLTNAEVLQLENIGSNTISSTQWGYISASNQRTDTAGTPSFSGLTLSTGVASLPAGTIGTPSLNFGDAATGIYRTALNQIGITTNGSLITYWSTTGLLMNTGAISALAGSVGTPAINLSDTTTGFYRPGANQIGMTVSGTNIATWSSTGLALNNLDITGVVNLAGTLSTATQPNITSVGTSGVNLRLTGNIGINAVPFDAFTAVSIGGTSSYFDLIQFNGTLGSSFDVNDLYLFNAIGNMRTAGSTNIYMIKLTPNMQIYGDSGIFYGYVLQPGFTFNNSSVLNTYYGVYITSSPSGVTNAISGYFEQPTSGSSIKIGVYAGSLSVGSSSQLLGAGESYFSGNVTLNSGAMISGNTLIGATSNPDSRKLLVNGSIESSTGGIYGTIQTATQPNITTIGSTGILLTNPGKLLCGSSTPLNAILVVDNVNQLFTGVNNYASVWTTGTINLFTHIDGAGSQLVGLRLNETLTSSDALDSDEYHAVYIATTISPLGGTGNIYRGITVAPTIGTAGTGNGFIGINVIPSFSNGANLTTLTGITITNFTSASSAITSVIGGSFPHPAVTSSGARMGIFAGSLSVGDSTKAMTDTNLYVAGTTTHNSTAIFAAGLVGTPSMYMSTDSTSGFYRPTTNQIGITISGSNIGTWSSTGLAMNTLAISGVSTLTATTLGGTLSTAAQTSITSLGSLTGLRINGTMGINQAGSTPFYQGITIDNTNYCGSVIQGTSTANTGTSYGLQIAQNYSPTSTNGNNYCSVAMTPTFASASSQTLSGVVSCMYLVPFFTGNAGTISNFYGIYFSGIGTLPGGTITNSYGGYFSTPGAGTNKFALYADNMAIGGSTVPPSSGLFVSGPTKLGTVNDNTNGNITSGSYTPTVSVSVSGGAASVSAGTARYIRIGIQIIVFGTFTITQSSGSTSTYTTAVSLPFTRTSNFGASTDANGSANTNTTIEKWAGYINASVGTKNLNVTLTFATAQSSTQIVNFEASYTEA